MTLIGKIIIHRYVYCYFVTKKPLQQAIHHHVSAIMKARPDQIFICPRGPAGLMGDSRNSQYPPMEDAGISRQFFALKTYGRPWISRFFLFRKFFLHRQIGGIPDFFLKFEKNFLGKKFELRMSSIGGVRKISGKAQ